jgi:3-dehydroquinate synthase
MGSRVRIELPPESSARRYDVVIEPGAIARLGEGLRAVAPHDRCALISDESVHALHGAAAEASLRAAGFDVVTACVAPGEGSKSLASAARLYDVLLDHRLERRSPLVALGGGVVGDLVGFVAATYLRGVPFVQCPTTLLAMVDSSVGGKTGVNVPQGKNLIGAFHQPVAVFADPLTLASLPSRELRCGLAECVKHGVIRDASLVSFIRDGLAQILAAEPEVLTELVRRNVEIKAAVVVEDERETGVRAQLNLGHTFGHAIEATAGYGRILHGEAVGLGMLAAAHTASALGICEPTLCTQLASLLEAAGLPVRTQLPDDSSLDAAMKLDKKVANARIRFVLPERLGSVVIRSDVPEACVRKGWQAIRS